MFTAEQIITAHRKVKSGADFPAYIKEIKELGVTQYEAFVSDGHVNYYSTKDHKVRVPQKYNSMTIAETVNEEVFKAELSAHQKGETDYLTFIQMCAETGIEKWEICMEKMTCTYFDKAGNEVLEEKIP